VSLLSTALVIALIAVGATSLVMSLNAPAQPERIGRLANADPSIAERRAHLIRCAATIRPVPDPSGFVDPGTLDPTPVEPFASQMPAGPQTSCFFSGSIRR
jgi:hypothetical protein